MPGTFGRVVEVDESTGVRHVYVKAFCGCMYGADMQGMLRWRDDEYTSLDAVEAPKAAHVCFQQRESA